METVMLIYDYLCGTDHGALLIRLLFAALAGSLIGIERGRAGRSAGMRTHGLVCLGAALAVEVGMIANQVMAPTADPMRVAAQVISGIGFLGVGTILVKGRFQITGLTTAAGLWATATVGLAIGVGFLWGAFVALLLLILLVIAGSYLENRMLRRHRRFGLYMEIDSADHVRSVLSNLKESYRIEDVEVIPARTALGGHVGVEVSVYTYDGTHHTPEEVITHIERIDGIIFVLESI